MLQILLDHNTLLKFINFLYDSALLILLELPYEVLELMDGTVVDIGIDVQHRIEKGDELLRVEALLENFLPQVVLLYLELLL